MNTIIYKCFRHIDRFYKRSIIKEQYPMLSFLSRNKLRKQGTLGVVYMLHHITNKDKARIPTNDDLKVSPQFLEKIIYKYKSKGFNFISLDDLSYMISQKQINKAPFVAFTIDDGYQDNYTIAYPVFKKHHIPFTLFIATDFIDKKAILWWDALEELIIHNDTITTSDGVTYSCQTFQERWDTFRYLRDKILDFDQNILVDMLNQFFNHYCIDWYEPIRKQAMSWEQVISISKDPLCTIGGHTVSHPALNRVSEERFNYEINECISILKTKIGQDIRHFAFPYGSSKEIGVRELKLISNYNFETIFMANGGCITNKNIYLKHQLPRVYLQEF